MKKKKRIGCMLSIFLLGLCACGQNSDIYLEEYEKNTSATEMTETGTFTQAGIIDTEESGNAKEIVICYVYICGAVERPGVYELPEGSRIYEVIQEAGGLTEDADETLVNQAEPVIDGMMIRIYTREETEGIVSEPADLTGMDQQIDDGKVDINTASVTELMTLPGIGTSKAEAIVAYREEHGDFSSIEDLMKIPGIKEGIFQQIREHIKVNN